MATATDAVATVYARSLYELAESAGGLDKVVEVGDELEQICELTRSDASFRELLASPIIDRKARGTSLSTMFQDRISDLTLRFLLVVNEKGRLGHLETISAAHQNMVQEAMGRIEVDVFTPSPIDDEQLQMIGRRVKEAIGKEPVLHAYTEPAMIGGLKLRIGDQLIDGSAATRLRRLRQRLMTRGATAIQERAGRIIEEGGE
jgi:F-type H+-transporting ATPase subunit delta